MTRTRFAKAYSEASKADLVPDGNAYPLDGVRHQCELGRTWITGLRYERRYDSGYPPEKMIMLRSERPAKTISYNGGANGSIAGLYWDSGSSGALS